MNRQKLSQKLTGAVLITVLVVGCSIPAVTPIPPTATSIPPSPASQASTLTATLSSATSTQAFTLATSAEKIVGTWVAGNDYIRFDENGTFRQAHALDKLSGPYAISSYQFEGTAMVITEVSVAGVPSCGIKIGSYEIHLLESGNIRIVPIEDPCGPRAGEISGEYEPVR